MNENYQTINSNMEKIQVIMQNQLTSLYTPQTEYLSLENLEYMLTKHEKIVFKSDDENNTNNIGVIFKSTNEFSIHYQNTISKTSTLQEIIDFIESISEESTFIIQESIDSLTFNGLPIIMRVYLQKPYDTWEITGSIAKVFVEEENFIDNFLAPNTPMEFETLLTKLSYSDAEIAKLKIIMFSLTHNIADSLTCIYPNIKSLGFNIAVDTSLWPWVLDINTSPQFSDFQKLKNLSMYNKILHYNRIIHKIAEDKSENTTISDSTNNTTIPENSTVDSENKTIKNELLINQSINEEPINIKKSIMESALIFENCLGDFLCTESRKIDYLICKEATPETLLEVNRSIEKSFENIYLIEKQILCKLERGLSLNECTDNDE